MSFTANDIKSRQLQCGISGQFTTANLFFVYSGEIACHVKTTCFINKMVNSKTNEVTRYVISHIIFIQYNKFITSTRFIYNFIQIYEVRTARRPFLAFHPKR